jgi:hypothetical protein
MKLDTDPFSVNTIGCEERKILVQIDQAGTTQGKNVIVSDELRNRMTKLHNPEVGAWKENTLRKPERRVKPTTSMLVEKHVRQRQERSRAHIHESKRTRSPCYDRKRWLRYGQHAVAQQGPKGMQTRLRIMVRDDGPSHECAKGSR